MSQISVNNVRRDESGNPVLEPLDAEAIMQLQKRQEAESREMREILAEQMKLLASASKEVMLQPEKLAKLTDAMCGIFSVLRERNF